MQFSLTVWFLGWCYYTTLKSTWARGCKNEEGRLACLAWININPAGYWLSSSISHNVNNSIFCVVISNLQSTITCISHLITTKTWKWIMTGIIFSMRILKWREVRGFMTCCKYSDEQGSQQNWKLDSSSQLHHCSASL